MALTVTEKAIIAKAVLEKKLPMHEFLKFEYSNDFGSGTGDFVNLSIPAYPTAFTGLSGTAEAISDKKIPLAVELKNVMNVVNAKDRTLDIKDWEKQVAMPAMAALAEKISRDEFNTALLAAEITEVKTSANFDDLAVISGKIRDSKVNEYSEGGAFLSNVLNSKVISTGNKWMTAKLSEQNYEGNINMFDGFNYIATSIARPVATGWVPTSGSTIGATVNTNGATSITIADAGLTSANTIKAGTVFQVANVNLCNVLGDDLGIQRSFVVAEDKVASAGSVAVKVAELTFTGAGKNCSTVITSGATVTTPMSANSVYQVGVLFAKDSIAGASKVPVSPESGNGATAPIADGINVRITYDYSNDNTNETVRYSTYHGVKAVHGKGIGAYFVKV